MGLAGCAGQEPDAPPAAGESRPAAAGATVAAVSPTAAVPASATPVPATATPVPTPTPPAPLAALVNGDYVFLADYEQRVAQYEQALRDQGVDLSTADGAALLQQARADVLEGLIDGVLIEQGGAELGITVGEQEVTGQLEADVATGGGEAAFAEWLEATGQTRDDYREMLRQSLVGQRVMEAVTAGVPPEAEQVHVRHILLGSEEEALQVASLLEGGADLIELVRIHSLDVATRENGGDLGWFPRGLVAPELETAAFGLQPGQISEVIRLGEGYHILQVVEREAARALPVDMQIQLRQAMFEQWLEGRRAAAVVERFVGE
ncbi:MAG TPA: peptidylprolyl isomerase [Anaerolineae bacterium]|nr:peptidylprolyl isomerase [Anaerolineae bacterium]